MGTATTTTPAGTNTSVLSNRHLKPEIWAANSRASADDIIKIALNKSLNDYGAKFLPDKLSSSITLNGLVDITN